MYRRFVLLCLKAGAVTACLTASTVLPEAQMMLSRPTDDCIVVEEISLGSALERGGVNKGDVYFSWELTPNTTSNPPKSKGILKSVYDWMELEIEYAPRGSITLHGLRGEETLQIRIPWGMWEARVRPCMDLETSRIYRLAEDKLRAGEHREAVQYLLKITRSPESRVHHSWFWLAINRIWAEAQDWQQADMAALEASEESQDVQRTAFVWDSVGRIYRDHYKLEESVGAYNKAEALLSSTKLSLWKARVQAFNAGVHSDLGNIDKAENLHLQVVKTRRHLAPDSHDMAVALSNYAYINDIRDRLDVASEYLERALELHRKHETKTEDYAICLNNLSNNLYKRGNYIEAEKLQLQALAIYREIKPGSRSEGITLANLGVTQWEKGNLFAGERYLGEALDIFQQNTPGSLDVATTLQNLANLARQRGDLEIAERYYERSLSIYEATAPRGLDAATTLFKLGLLAQIRSEIDLARDYTQQAMELFRNVVPGSLNEADCLDTLGELAIRSSDFESARVHLHKALEIKKRLTPSDPGVGYTLANLGDLAMAHGDPNLARSYLIQALKFFEGSSRNVVGRGRVLSKLGVLAEESGTKAEAGSYYREALRIFQYLSDGSVHEAAMLHALGRLASGGGNLDAATQYLERAMNAIEKQINRLGASHRVRGDFGREFNRIYYDAISVYIKRQDLDQAFFALERSRARRVLDMLSEKELIFSRHLSREDDVARRRIAVEFDNLFEKIEAHTSTDGEAALEDLHAKLRSLRNERERLNRRIVESSPEFSSLQNPEPLDVIRVKEVLEPGVLMINFSVGESKTFLLVLSTTDGVIVHELHINESELNRRVKRLLWLIDKVRKTTGIGGSYRDALFFESRSLYDVLFEPIEEKIGTSQRLMISPDKILHKLPFATLVRQNPESNVTCGRSWQYLVEWKPLSIVLSGTLYAEIKAKRGGRGESVNSSFAGFGDPSFGRLKVAEENDPIDDTRLRSLIRRGVLKWQELPYSRYEIQQIASMFESTQIFLGEQATEEQVRSIGENPTVVHFATHAYVDERFPLNSGLVLSVPDGSRETGKNGFLQAWEIFEDLQLDADLVVLSACNSALGKDQGGDGLLGLTRAFQYAGARTVAATMWRVSDRATAELMVAFYKQRHEGKSKDEALQSAQIDMVERSFSSVDGVCSFSEADWSLPYYWGSFQLYGDWY